MPNQKAGCMTGIFSFSDSVTDVAKRVIELVEDDTKIGEVLVVCITDGTKYKQFTN